MQVSNTPHTTPVGAKTSNPGSAAPETDAGPEQDSDEQDHGGFGHTPWGVGLQHRTPQAHVRPEEALPRYGNAEQQEPPPAPNPWQKVTERLRRFWNR